VGAFAPGRAHPDATLPEVDAALVVIGIAGLYGGGDLLVKHAARLARVVGLSPLVIGLTVVAFGTSAPELAATVVAAVRGVPEIALGNVIGSNIANIGLILGLTALLYPLATRWGFVKRELPFLVVATMAAAAMLLDGRLDRVEGGVLLAGLALFLVVALRGAPLPPAHPASEQPPRRPAGATWRELALAMLGIVVLVAAAQALVSGATGIARGFGVSERVIGLTMVAVGTSLPELASSLVAVLRRETDIILGNVIGSNVFNLLSVLAVAGLVHPIAVDAAQLRLDLAVMLGFTLVAVAMLLTGMRVGRREGAALLLAYAAYVLLLFR
jgi:cation:H+ antiporter